MDIYIGNIPDDVNDYDLRKFFQVVGEQASFRVVTNDVGHNKVRRYGLVRFESDKAARQMVKRCNGMLFKEHRVVVREFIHRNYSNDRRALNWRQRAWDKAERRCRDRRGLMLEPRSPANAGIAVFELD